MQYTSYAFGKRCREAGIVPSMGPLVMPTTTPWPRASSPPWTGGTATGGFHSQAEAKIAVFRWLEGWYNPHRRHSSLGYLSPINYETENATQGRLSPKR